MINYQLIRNKIKYILRKQNTIASKDANNLDNKIYPECATRIITEKDILLSNAASIENPHKHAKSIFESFPNSNKFRNILEIGGSTSNNIMSFFPNLKYYNLDIIDNPNIPTIVGDITQKIDYEDNSFDLIFSNNTLEHINQPWLAAKEICRLLNVGGICYISTVWSWRYHPVPIDYWRFSPKCLMFLFKDLKVIESNFNMFNRRRDQRGFWPNKIDSVPIDNLGGWRENWSVYFIGTKIET